MSSFHCVFCVFVFMETRQEAGTICVSISEFGLCLMTYNIYIKSRLQKYSINFSQYSLQKAEKAGNLMMPISQPASFKRSPKLPKQNLKLKLKLLGHLSPNHMF